MLMDLETSNLPAKEKKIYLLIYNDKFNEYAWNIEIKSEPSYIQKKPQYKFSRTGVAIDYETNVLEIKINYNNSTERSILKRSVIIEKKNYKSQPYYTNNDPITEWSIKSLFSSNLNNNLMDFKLIKIDSSGLYIDCWFLVKCSLLNSTVWKNISLIDDKTNTIWIKPDCLLQCP
jgi:ribosomal protein L21E